MTTIKLNRVDVEAIRNLMQDLNARCVTIGVDSSSGIGSSVTATVMTEVNGYRGEFTVVIADEENW